MKKLIAVLFSLVVVSGMMVFAEEAFVQYEFRPVETQVDDTVFSILFFQPCLVDEQQR